MAAAGQTFDAENKNFRLQDVLDLQLGRVPDAVNEIIQAATVWISQRSVGLRALQGSPIKGCTQWQEPYKSSL